MNDPLGSEPITYIPAAQADPQMLAVIHVWFQPSWIVRTAGPVRVCPARCSGLCPVSIRSLPFSGFHSMIDHLVSLEDIVSLEEGVPQDYPLRAKRSNDTHQSTTDPDARLYKKSYGKESKLSYLGHALVENRNGLIAAAMVTHADRYAVCSKNPKRSQGEEQRVTRGTAASPSWLDYGCDTAWRLPSLMHPTSMTTLQRNNVNVLGSGTRTLMFAHGYGCDQKMWRAVSPAFEGDFKIVLFDYVGAGDSDLASFDRTRYSTLLGYAKDVLEIIGALELENVNFVGHSVSSMIGALAAIERPDLFESVVMIGPSPCYINDTGYVGGFERSDIDDLLEQLASNHLGWSAAMAPVIMGNPEQPELAAELEASFCRTHPRFAQHFARVTFLSDNRADLARLKTRALILQCDKDVIAPPSVGEYVHKCLPESRYVLMKATGHCPHLSAPAEVIQAMRQFL